MIFAMFSAFFLIARPFLTTGTSFATFSANVFSMEVSSYLHHIQGELKHLESHVD